MSNSLIHELFAQISRLESQNSQLKSQLSSYQSEVTMVCKYTQFASWNQFMEWVTRQYEVASSSSRGGKTFEQAQEEEDCTEGSSALHTEGRIEKYNYFGKDAPGQSMKTSEILEEGQVQSKGEQNNWTSKFKGRMGFTFQKTKHRGSSSSLEFDQQQRIVVENSRLRRYSQQLQKQLSVYFQNIKSLVNLVGTEDMRWLAK